MNLLREVEVPRDLELMRGYDGKTTKTNMTDKFHFEFGASGEFSSILDFAAKVLYEALSEKTKENNEEQDLLAEISSYFKNCLLLDDKIRWLFVENQKNKEIKEAFFEESLSEEELDDDASDLEIEQKIQV